MSNQSGAQSQNPPDAAAPPGANARWQASLNSLDRIGGTLCRHQSWIGTLLIGGGLCTAYFCAAAFWEARSVVDLAAASGSAPSPIRLDPNLDKLLNNVTTVDVSALKNLSENELRCYHLAVHKRLEAYRLLSASIALVLGGLCLILSARGQPVGSCQAGA